MTPKMLSIGQEAPDFTLPDQNGKAVKLSSFRRKKEVVVFFYPKSGTPGCTKEAAKFNDAAGEFTKAGAVVFGVSSDNEQKAFVESNNWSNLNLLSDEGGKVREAWEVPKALFGALDGRVTYIIGKDGKVKEIFQDMMNTDKHVEVALKAVA